jgi:hypothetical protein
MTDIHTQHKNPKHVGPELPDVWKGEMKLRQDDSLLVYQFGRHYIRFETNRTYMLPLMETDASLILDGTVPCEMVVNYYLNQDSDIPGVLVDAFLMDALEYTTDYSAAQRQKMLEKLHRYGDIFDECYCSIIFGRYGSDIEESGYTAARLAEGYDLTPFGVYNYLINLREKPEEALLGLAKGLPRK